MDIALPELNLGPKVRRYVRLLIDSRADPSTYVFEVPGSALANAKVADPAQQFREQMLRMGAEAVVYLGYTGDWHPLYVKILRYAEASEVEKQWSARKSAGWRLGCLQIESLVPPPLKRLFAFYEKSTFDDGGHAHNCYVYEMDPEIRTRG